MLGKQYIIDHCVTKIKKESEQTALRVYITDALKAVVENTAKIGGGVTMRRRYADIINNVPDDEETNEQAQKRAKGIIDNMKAKLNSLSRKEDADNAANESVCNIDT